MSYSYIRDKILMYAHCKWAKHHLRVFYSPLISSCSLVPIINWLSGLVNSIPKMLLDISFAPSFLLKPPWTKYHFFAYTIVYLLADLFPTLVGLTVYGLCLQKHRPNDRIDGKCSLQFTSRKILVQFIKKGVGGIPTWPSSFFLGLRFTMMYFLVSWYTKILPSELL